MGLSYITLAGLNMAYENQHGGKDIFDDIILPDNIERETLINRIMFRCMEFSMMSSDYDFVHAEILNFFSVHYRTFEKWITAIDLDYDPIENYNRTEVYEGDGTNAGENSSSGTDSSTDTNTRAAYNSSSYEPYERDSVSGTSSASGSNSGSYAEGHTLHAFGNIGITSNQDMIRQEWEIASLNVYTAIADLFADEFCVMVY